MMVDIPHDEKNTPMAPASAPPLPELEPLPVRPINITDNVTQMPPAAAAVPPIPEHEFHEQDGRHWPVTLMYIVLAFLVACLVVFAGRWIYRKTTHQTTTSGAPSTSDNNKPPSTPQSGTTGSPTSGTGQSQTTSQLPNNGPGDVAAIFVGVSLATAGIHYIVSIRRFNLQK